MYTPVVLKVHTRTKKRQCGGVPSHFVHMAPTTCRWDERELIEQRSLSRNRQGIQRKKVCLHRRYYYWDVAVDLPSFPAVLTDSPFSKRKVIFGKKIWGGGFWTISSSIYIYIYICLPTKSINLRYSHHLVEPLIWKLFYTMLRKCSWLENQLYVHLSAKQDQ